METQFAIALLLFATFWVGCFAGYLAMKLRAQVAYEQGRSTAAAEIAVLQEKLKGKEEQVVEYRQKAESAAAAYQTLDASLRAEADRRTAAEGRLAILPKYEEELNAREARIAQQNVELTRLHAAVAQLATRLEEAKRSGDEKIAAIQTLEIKLAETFQAMSAEALKSNNQAFIDLAGQTLGRFQESAKGDLDVRQVSIGGLVEPLKASLEKVDARIGELEKERASAYAALTQQVEVMMQSQAKLQAETARMARALRAPAGQGRWGELQLKRVVELAGMSEYCDFTEQFSMPTEDGCVRPDLVIHLPNHRDVIVDAKVSLSAYLDAQECTEDSPRAEKLRAHAHQVRAHVTQLSAKSYWEQLRQTPEFVIAFLPGEPFFSAALESDPDLLEYGVERRVILATPTTLIALLKAVALGWKQEKVSANAREIQELGRSLYDRMRTLAENFGEVQKGLLRTTAAFNRTVGTLEARVMPAARRFQELGASSGEEISLPSPVDTAPRSLQLLSQATEFSEEPAAIA
jgi:DNA recombination protein RmuC